MAAFIGNAERVVELWVRARLTHPHTESSRRSVWMRVGVGDTFKSGFWWSASAPVLFNCVWWSIDKKGEQNPTARFLSFFLSFFDPRLSQEQAFISSTLCVLSNASSHYFRLVFSTLNHFLPFSMSTPATAWKYRLRLSLSFFLSHTHMHTPTHKLTMGLSRHFRTTADKLSIFFPGAI